jgi:hypothetical protein
MEREVSASSTLLLVISRAWDHIILTFLFLVVLSQKLVRDPSIL